MPEVKKTEPTIAPPRQRSIKQVYLHQAVTWPGVTAAERNLSEAKIRGLIMEPAVINGVEGLLLKVRSKEALIPSPAISIIIFHDIVS